MFLNQIEPILGYVMDIAKRTHLSLFTFLFILFLTPQACAMLYNWEQPFQKSISLKGHKDEILVLQLSPDESFILTADAKGVAKIWDSNSGLLLHTLKADYPGPILCATISADSSTIALTNENSCITIWDTATGLRKKSISCDSGSMIMRMHFKVLSLENKTVPCLIACTQDKNITCYNTTTGKVAHVFDELKNKDIYAFDIDFNTNTVVSSKDTIDLYDLTTKEIIATIPGQYARVCFGSIKNQLVLQIKDSEIGVWDILSSKLIMTAHFQNSWGLLDNTTFCHNDKYLRFSHIDPKTTLWDIEKNRSVVTLSHTQNGFLELSPDAHYGIFTAPDTQHKECSIVHVSTNSLIKNVNYCGKNSWYKGLVVSPSGKFLAVVSDNDKAEIHFFHKKLFERHTEHNFKKIADAFIRFK